MIRYALFEAYNRVCPYCSNQITRFREMEVDHILPSEYRERPELKSYIDYLESCGFQLDKPDYIENYFPAHPWCNRDKSNQEMRIHFRIGKILQSNIQQEFYD